MTNPLNNSRIDEALSAIDRANADDPNMVEISGARRPAEVLYGERMTEMLHQAYPGASESLQLAARAQHLKRWTVPRSAYPDGRQGYLRWRNDLKGRHGELAGEILKGCGYGPETIERVQSLIRKERLKRDPESQALEDVACLVFLKHYFTDFAAKHDDEKLVNILRKTWAKMSPHGRNQALGLELTAKSRRLVEQAIAD